MNVGIDAGSIFLKVVVLDGDGRLRDTFSRRHAGRPDRAFHDAVDRLGLDGASCLGLTGDRAEALAAGLGLPAVDTLRATIRGALHHAPEARNVIDAGGASITLAELDEHGALRSYETNSLCAAGTGSFLDAQAERLGIEPEETAEFQPVLEPPTIASRCTVFAKSDLIHRQQEGYDREALWCGLCRGLASTLLQTLLRGRSLEGETVVVGGVSRNREVMRWLGTLQDAPIRTWPGAELAGAEGAALIAADEGIRPGGSLRSSASVARPSRSEASRPPLILERTRYPSFEVREAWEDDLGNEVRVTRWPGGPAIRSYLGIDVGSTSTKLVLTDDSGEVLVDVYRKTAGDPIGATKRLFTALERLASDRRTGLRILGSGTTGSGRKLVGAVIRADAVINEISAHVAGALATDRDVDTIFEIGGQDSKFIRVRDGIIRDVNMNYVCAAGTGSFVEEQARKLGYAASELSDLVCGVAPPSTSDRCTVFMQEDMEQLLREGHTPAEALAAVHYSVVQNYLSKVVGTRPYSREKIFFCGATARNRGLVAAFEQLLGAEMVVSPYCHVLGALGVARLARDEMARRSAPSRFVGLDLSGRSVTIRQEVCEVCENMCRITHAHIEGETEVPSWGYLCGRDPDATEKREAPELEPFEERTRLVNLAVARHRRRLPPDAPVAGLAQALGTYSHRALLQTFLNQVGFHVKLSTPSTAATRERGSALVGAEYCFPAKLAHGHLTELLDDERVAFVFAPHLVSESVPPEQSNAYFCPVVSAAPAVVRSAARMNRHPRSDRIVSPVIDLRWAPERQARELADSLAGPLDRSAAEIASAWMEALRAQEDYQTSIREAAPRILEELQAKGGPILLVLGRPYNLFDGGANLELPQKIAEHGFPLLPMDLAPWHDTPLPEGFHNVFWTYGQDLLRALCWVRGQPDVHPVWFTNFKCGPDSFLLSFGEAVLGEKPFLTLELDEHGGDAGYMTRVEAFLDVVRQAPPLPRSRPSIPRGAHTADELRERRIWLPPMHPLAARLVAAAFRAQGYDAESLPLEDEACLDLGRSVTRGGECLPLTLTIGRLLSRLRQENGNGDGEPDGKGHAFFLPHACGPCRFGCYELLHRLVLEREGFGEVAFLTPSNDNAYQGLGESLRRASWLGILTADVLFKLACRFRPYEGVPGTVDGLMEEVVERAVRETEAGVRSRTVLAHALEPFHRLGKPRGRRPLVGIVGEIYVRCNPMANQELVRSIEAAGGEAWLSPFSEWMLFSCYEHERRGREGWDILGQAKAFLKNRYLFETERIWYKDARALLAGRHEPPVDVMVEAARPYASFNFGGEVQLVVGRTVCFARGGADLVVNCSPFGCLPGALMTGLFNEVQRDFGTPIVNLFYDGAGDLNRRVEVFLRNLAGRGAGSAAGTPYLECEGDRAGKHQGDGDGTANGNGDGRPPTWPAWLRRARVPLPVLRPREREEEVRPG